MYAKFCRQGSYLFPQQFYLCLFTQIEMTLDRLLFMERMFAVNDKVLFLIEQIAVP